MQLKKNSIKIIKFLFSSGTSFLLDLILFTIFNYFLKNTFKLEAIFLATIFARILSSLYNYFLNSRFVFKNFTKTSIFKYYILVILQMMISASLVYFINKYVKFLNPTIIKFNIEIILFLINYFVQNNFIFISKRDNKRWYNAKI